MNSLEEVKRFKELHEMLSKNNEVSKLFEEVKNKQQQLVNARNYKQEEQAKIYEKEYNELLEKLKDLPFVEEYQELSEIVNEKLGDVAYLLEDMLDDVINKQ